MIEKGIPKRFPWESWKEGILRRRAWKQKPDPRDVVESLLEAYTRDDQDTFESITSFCKKAKVSVQEGLIEKLDDPISLPSVYAYSEGMPEFYDLLAAKGLISSADLPKLWSHLQVVEPKFEESFLSGKWDNTVKYGTDLLGVEKRLGKDTRCTSCKLTFAKSFVNNQLLFRELQPEKVLGGRCSNRFESSIISPHLSDNPQCIMHSLIILNPGPRTPFGLRSPLSTEPLDIDKHFQIMNGVLTGSVEGLGSLTSYFNLLFECYVLAAEERYEGAAYVCHLCCEYLARLSESEEAADLSLHFSLLRDSCLPKLLSPRSERPIEKVSCKKCGAKIMPITAKKTDGLCMPCYSPKSKK